MLSCSRKARVTVVKGMGQSWGVRLGAVTGNRVMESPEGHCWRWLFHPQRVKIRQLNWDYHRSRLGRQFRG